MLKTLKNFQIFIYLLLFTCNTAYADACIKSLESMLYSKKEKIELTINQTQLSSENKRLIKNYMSKSNYKFDMQLSKRIITYSDILKQSDVPKFINSLGELNNKKIKNKLVKKFASINTTIDKRVAKERLKGRFSNIAKFEQDFTSIAYGCKVNSWNPARKKAAINTQGFFLGIGIASNTFSYSTTHWDEEKDAQWFGKLGYELGIVLLSNWISSKILSNPSNTVFQQWYKGYYKSRLVGLLDLGAYSALFGTSQSDALKKLEELRSDKNFDKKMAELEPYFENKKLFQKYKEILFNTYKNVINQKDITNNNKNLNLIKQEDLDNPKVQKKLLEAILAKEYDEKNDGPIQTGNNGLDRYSYNALFGLAYTPISLPMGIYIYQTLCMGSLTPKETFLKAAAIYTAYKMFSGQTYFYTRDKLIGQ